jgi:tetratricopeptide (TPR) repeat protein
LPFALDQTGAYIDAQQITVAACLGEYEENFANVASRKPFTWEYGDTVWTAWESTYSALDHEEAYTDTCPELMLLLISYLNPDSISQEVCQGNLSFVAVRVPSLSSGIAFFEIYALPILDVTCSVPDTLQLLMRYSLIKRKQRDGDFAINPLLHNWIYERTTAELQAHFAFYVWNFMTTALNHLTAADWVSQYPRPLNWREYVFVEATDRVIKHISSLSYSRIRRLRMTLYPHIGAFSRIMMKQRFDTDFQGSLFQIASETLINHGQWRQAEVTLNQFSELLHSNYGVFDHSYIMDINSLIAHFRQRMGQLTEAYSLRRSYVDWCENNHGPEDQPTLIGKVDLAETLTFLGELDAAQELLEDVRPKFETALQGPISVRLRLQIASNLAWLLFRRRSFTRAIDMQQQLLAEAMTELGEANPQTSMIRNDLALSYIAVGKPGEARKILRRAIFNQELLFGPLHPNTLVYKSNLALAYANESMYEFALPLAIEITAQWQQFLPEHPASLLSMQDLATIYSELGMEAKTIETREKAVALRTTDVTLRTTDVTMRITDLIEMNDLRRGYLGWLSDAPKTTVPVRQLAGIVVSVLVFSGLQVLWSLFILPSLALFWRRMLAYIYKPESGNFEGPADSAALGSGRPNVEDRFPRGLVVVHDDAMCHLIAEWNPRYNDHGLDEDFSWAFAATVYPFLPFALYFTMV